MPKFKFSNSAQSTQEVAVLRAPHYDELCCSTSALSADIHYLWDENDDNAALRLRIDEQWFGVSDLDELIAFAKAAKKRIAKINA